MYGRPQTHSSRVSCAAAEVTQLTVPVLLAPRSLSPGVQVSSDWRRAGHVTTILPSDWSGHALHRRHRRRAPHLQLRLLRDAGDVRAGSGTKIIGASNEPSANFSQSPKAPTSALI